MSCLCLFDFFVSLFVVGCGVCLFVWGILLFFFLRKVFSPSPGSSSYFCR